MNSTTESIPINLKQNKANTILGAQQSHFW